MTIAPDGPFEVQLTIHAGDGTYRAQLVYSLPPGVVPTKEVILEYLADVKKTLASEKATKGFKLMGRHEFVNQLLAERAGVTGAAANFAISGPDEWALDVVDQSGT